MFYGQFVCRDPVTAVVILLKPVIKMEAGELDVSNPYGPAIAHWQRQSVPLLSPATDHEIDVTFSQFQMLVSDDVRLLYRTTGGFAEHESDNMWSLWSLDRIFSENRNRESDIVWFADWLISSHMYGIRYTDSASSAVYLDHNSSDHPPELIACNVIEFLQQYANNPDNVSAWIIE
jgi:hypothetical protein